MDWTGLVKHGLIKHGVIKHGLIEHAVIKHGLKRRFYGSVRFGVVVVD